MQSIPRGLCLYTQSEVLWQRVMAGVMMAAVRTFSNYGRLKMERAQK